MKRLEEIKVGKRLSNDEMKLIRGGSITCVRWQSSQDPNSNTITLTYFTPGSMEVGYAWCDVWVAFGYHCGCKSTDSPVIYC